MKTTTYRVTLRNLATGSTRTTTIRSPASESEIELYGRAVRKLRGRGFGFHNDLPGHPNIGRVTSPGRHGGTDLHERVRIDTEVALGADAAAWRRSPRHNPEPRCIVKTVHGGTDWAIARASRRDVELGDSMTHAEAVKLCRAKMQEATRKGYALNVYDFSGDPPARTRRKAKAPRRT